MVEVAVCVWTQFLCDKRSSGRGFDERQRFDNNFVYCGEVPRDLSSICLTQDVEVVASYETRDVSVGGGGDAGVTSGITIRDPRAQRSSHVPANKSHHRTLVRNINVFLLFSTDGADHGAVFTNRAETERNKYKQRAVTERLRINNEIHT